VLPGSNLHLPLKCPATDLWGGAHTAVALPSGERGQNSPCPCIFGALTWEMGQGRSGASRLGFLVKLKKEQHHRYICLNGLVNTINWTGLMHGMFAAVYQFFLIGLIFFFFFFVFSSPF